ncbi:permease-like cell division protein FtsX [Rhizohabitans arisaemae]|uniref:permease-like cell division protein FtsX n=1 Tax=Rhizohabitans arisaemae TaxID=2720610 RepID=UPI0024B20ADF|nr:permease-like cell division protein FtsX [Rhizohabitans arisaemae]
MSSVKDRLREATGAKDGDEKPPQRHRELRIILTGTVGVALAAVGTACGVVQPASSAAEPRQQVIMSLLGAAPPLDRGVRIFLCTAADGRHACAATAATESEKESVRQLLTARPDVKTVTFESRGQAYERLRQASADNPGQPPAEENLPESFHVRLADGADTSALARAVSGLPGVLLSVDQSCLIEAAGSSTSGRRALTEASALCSFPGKGR